MEKDRIINPVEEQKPSGDEVELTVEQFRALFLSPKKCAERWKQLRGECPKSL